MDQSWIWVWSKFEMSTAFKRNALKTLSVRLRKKFLSCFIWGFFLKRGKRGCNLNCCAWSVKITDMAEWGLIQIQTRSGKYYIVPSSSVEPIRMRLHMIGALNQTLAHADDWRGVISVQQISHLAQVCGTPGSGHAQRMLWVWMCWWSSPHTAGCQTAGWGWKERTSMCRNSGAPWTQPAGAPVNHKHKCSPWFSMTHHTYFSPQTCILPDGDVSAQFSKGVWITLHFRSFCFFIFFFTL